MMLPTIAEENILPQPGDIRKNIHILFDQSGSMSLSEHQAALQQIEAIVSQAFDEFNLKVTAFGHGHATLIPSKDGGFDILEEAPTWMSLPSQNNLDRVKNWLGSKQVESSHTQALGATLAALAEDIDDLTIIVVSDCILDDGEPLSDAIKIAQKEREKRHFDVAGFGFINISDSALAESTTSRIRQLYNECEPNGWFWMNMRKNDR